MMELEVFIKPVLIIMAIAMAVWVIAWRIFITSKKRQGIRITSRAEIFFFLFYMYIVGVLSLTVFPLPFARFENGEGNINLTPITNTVKNVLLLWQSYPEHGSVNIQHTIQNIVGNIILFFPLGIFLPMLSYKYRSLIRVVLIAFICSVLIEATQFALIQFDIFRTVDIDDVILNTTGAFLGYIAVKKLYFKE